MRRRPAGNRGQTDPVRRDVIGWDGDWPRRSCGHLPVQWTSYQLTERDDHQWTNCTTGHSDSVRRWVSRSQNVIRRKS